MSLRRLFKWKETTNLPKALRYSLTSTWFRTEIVFEWWSSTPWLKIFNPTAGSHVYSSTPWISHLLRFEALLFAFFKLPIVFLHRFGGQGEGKISLKESVWPVWAMGEWNRIRKSPKWIWISIGDFPFLKNWLTSNDCTKLGKKKWESASSSLGNLRLSSYLVSNEDFHPGNVHLRPWRGPKKKWISCFHYPPGRWSFSRLTGFVMGIWWFEWLLQ